MADEMDADIDMSLGERFRVYLNYLAGNPRPNELVVLGAGRMSQCLIDAFVAKECFSKSEVVPVTQSQKSVSKWIDRGFERACTLTSYIQSQPPSANRIIMIGVKPQIRTELFDVLAVARDLKLEAVMILSILAGVTHTTLTKELSFLGPIPVVRLIPNIPSEIGAGVTLLYTNNEYVSKVSSALLRAAGEVFVLPESQFNAAAAVTGSGPAFVGLLVEGLADGGVLAGLPRDKAFEMTLLMLKGSIQLMLETGIHPGQLKDKVCSAAGTTIAGVRELEKGGVRSALIECIKATSDRAYELGNVDVNKK
ncbi:unnamed protein product [Bursaphelenchus xylophilus]|uniref:Pyrroline-5-carboxylate reductase n=1 Tax=Bursaphelenchus xylophilus TaxID=6326 RepID=A0A1I7S3L6_BURXY|nr:unnamed protein product [Bursaphelenchus xylophilus]CAG9116394.1 unnamed protein product [Bursaphelenchus xylophilus]